LQNVAARRFAARGEVSKSADVKQLWGEAARAFRRLEVLVNNAGVYSFGPLESATERNATGEEAVKLFGKEGGSVSNIGTAGTQNPGRAMVLYLSSEGLDRHNHSGVGEGAWG
jgi:3-oxoacyl-[acyl-carrier protein] reductase